MTSEIESKTSLSFSFSGHETFPFRHGWLKKGLDAITRDPHFFLHERAMVELGVGKNMVQSIRHWCLATKLIRESNDETLQRGRFAPTAIGKSIFSDDGFDPYLEDLATLWLLHWQLASNQKQATTWFWMFNHWNGVEFDKENAQQEILAWLKKQPYKPVAERSLERDVACFVRTYVASRQAKGMILEDTLDCPLVELRLITEIDEEKAYQFQRGEQASLPDEIFVMALAEFWTAIAAQQSSLALSKITYEVGGPGRIFKLDEESIAIRLERIETISDGAFTYGETAGIKQVYKHSEIEPLELLARCYQQRRVMTACTR